MSLALVCCSRMYFSSLSLGDPWHCPLPTIVWKATVNGSWHVCSVTGSLNIKILRKKGYRKEEKKKTSTCAYTKVENAFFCQRSFDMFRISFLGHKIISLNLACWRFIEIWVLSVVFLIVPGQTISWALYIPWLGLSPSLKRIGMRRNNYQLRT